MAEQFVSEWINQLDEVQPFARTIILNGNIKDAIYYSDQYYHSIRLFLQSYFTDKSYDLIGHYDLLDGLEFHSREHLDIYNELLEKSEIVSSAQDTDYHVPGESSRPVNAQTSDHEKGHGVFSSFSANSRDFYETFIRIRNIFNSKSCPPAVFIIYFSDQLTGSSQQMDLSERTNLILLMKIMEISRAVRGLNQAVVIVADEIARIPPALYFENPRCRQVYIPLPAFEERKMFIRKFYNLFHHSSPEQVNENTHIENLAVCTQGLGNFDLHNLSLLSGMHRICASDAKALVKRYKFGQKKSPWDSLSREKILGTPWKRLKRDAAGMPVKNSSGFHETETVQLPLRECLAERVIGQDHAIDAIETMIIRTVEGIYSAKASDTFSKPKGIFLFAGPTGVGKTELTKTLTEWLFGDESSMTRFDMSEFNQEHSDQKLIGSPPGYVGHEQGGQLTNMVKKKPFCVILFDEVDKMHPKIWDIFLQILDDGRLTDGTGDTAYFSETVIIMTSNLGGAKHPQGKDNKEIRTHYLKAVRDFFRKNLGRPEILNRIGMDNVIAFNSIEKEFQEKIIWQKLNGLSLSYVGKYGINLNFDPSVINYFMENPEGFAQNGARGVENLITTHIINPLSRYLFYNPEIKQGRESLTVKIFSEKTTETAFIKG